MLVALWGHCRASAGVLADTLSVLSSICRVQASSGKKDLDDVVQGVWLQGDELVQQADGLLDRSRMFSSSVFGSAMAAGLAQRVPMVSMSDAGSLDTAQGNLVRGLRDTARCKGGVDVSGFRKHA